MKIEIKNVRKYEKGTLRGFFTLQIGDFSIKDFTYHTKNGKSWVGFPSRQYKDKDTGEVKYSPIVFIENDDRYHAFQKWATEQARALFDKLGPEPLDGSF